LARFRKELSTASHPEATSSLKGEKNIPGAVAKEAQQEVKNILRAHKEPVLARDISKELDAMIERARKEGK
jgi:trimethylamine:corrinoid methyltransferase-like protein